MLLLMDKDVMDPPLSARKLSSASTSPLSTSERDKCLRDGNIQLGGKEPILEVSLSESVMTVENAIGAGGQQGLADMTEG